MRSTFPRSSVLLLGTNHVQSLVPSTILSQIEALLDSHRIQEAIELADQQRRKVQGNLTIDEDEAEELRYVYQRIGFLSFGETRFGEAFENFFNGELDPRLVISYFPDLRGSLFTSDDSMDVFAGVAEHMPKEASVEDIVILNLVRNYSPHLSPNTRSAPPTSELRKLLLAEAVEKLENFLKRWRSKWKVEAGDRAIASGSATGPKASDDPALVVVETVLAKLWAQDERTQDLYALLRDPESQVVLSEVEQVLQRNGQYNALCMLYKDRGETHKLLAAWAKIVEGEWTDEDIPDPISDMISLLTQKKDRLLTQKWGIWLLKRDPDRALKLLMPETSGKRREKKPEGEDLALLEQIQAANPEAGVQFLEYLVLQKRNSSPDLHTQLALSCLNHVVSYLGDESVSKLWRAKTASYVNRNVASSNGSSYLSYFASTTPDSPSKRARLKFILFLAGSSLYDAPLLRDRISEYEKWLKFEAAVVEAKLKNHRAVLQILIHDLNDPTPAEAYCALGGNVVPVRLVQTLVEQDPNLQLVADRLFGLSMAKDKAAKGQVVLPTPAPADERLRKNLTQVLLEVYLSEGEKSRTHAANIINSQGINMDVIDIVQLVPPSWSVKSMSSFLSRSFRRTLHYRHEGQIVKNLSAGQNLETKEETWLALQNEDYIVEEPLEDDDECGDGQLSEKGSIEKAALGLQLEGVPVHGIGFNGSEKVEAGGGDDHVESLT